MAITARFSTSETRALADKLKRASNQAPKIARIAVTEGGRAARKSLVKDVNRLGSFENYTGSVERLVKGRPAAGPAFRIVTTSQTRSLASWSPSGGGNGRLSGVATIRSMRARGMAYNPPVAYRGAFRQADHVERSFWQRAGGKGKLLPFQRVGDSDRYPLRVATGPSPAVVARSTEAFSTLDRIYKKTFFDSFDQGLSRVLL